MISDRLKNRVTDRIFPTLAGGFIAYGASADMPPADIASVYDASVSFLYKLLCLLFAESRNLLAIADRSRLQYLIEIALAKAPNSNSTLLYDSLRNLCEIGDRRWFTLSPATAEFLSRYKLTDVVLAPILEALTRDNGKAIDYSAIAVRLLGSIYEKLLESRLVVDDAASGRVHLQTDKHRRKATATYYTPDYIVKAIVCHTLDPILQECDRQFQAVIGQLAQTPFPQDGDRIVQQGWDLLLDIKVCDPAMGSGYFLMEAVDFIGDRLMQILQRYPAHHPIVKGLAIFLQNRQVNLENPEQAIADSHLTLRQLLKQEIALRCIYGVDLNPMAVELAKVSLWLHSCNGFTPPTYFGDRLRCANALLGISPTEGAKIADNFILQQDRIRCQVHRFFFWYLEFPEVFNRRYQRGFDAVISNPPYQRIQEIKADNSQLATYYKQRFAAATGRYDLYVLFIELSCKIISPMGRVGTIVPHKFIAAQFGKGIRRYLHNNSFSMWLCSFGSDILFPDASTYTCLLFLQQESTPGWYAELMPNTHSDPNRMAAFLQNLNLKEFKPMRKHTEDEAWIVTEVGDRNILEKLENCAMQLQEIAEGIYQGVVTGLNDIFILDSIGESCEEVLTLLSPQLQEPVKIERGILKPFIKGEDIERFGNLQARRLILYPYDVIDGTVSLYSEADLQSHFPLAYQYLLRNQESLQQRGSDRMNYESWYALWNSRNPQRFTAPKILVPDICRYGKMSVSFDSHLLHADTTYAIVPRSDVGVDIHALLAILNSKILWFFLTKIGTPLRGGYIRYKSRYLEQFPICDFNFDTPQGDRQRYREKGIDTYHYCVDKAEQTCILGFVEHHLRYGRTDVLHDLLADLSQQMLQMNERRSRQVNLFLTQLETEVGIEIEKLRYKNHLRNYVGDYQSDSHLSVEKFREILQKNKRQLSLDLDERSQLEKLAQRYQDSLDELLPLKARLATTDRLIDRIVYHLYGLTEAEMAIVEKS